jgi:hypothetical protein
MEDWRFGRQKTQIQWSILQYSLPKPGFWVSRNQGYGSHPKMRDSMKVYKTRCSDAYLVAKDLKINRVCVAFKGCQCTTKVEYRDGTSQDIWRAIPVPIWIGSIGLLRVYRTLTVDQSIRRYVDSLIVVWIAWDNAIGSTKIRSCHASWCRLFVGCDCSLSIRQGEVTSGTNTIFMWKFELMYGSLQPELRKVLLSSPLATDIYSS